MTRQMQGMPEGTGPPSGRVRRIPGWAVASTVIFLLYLGFRLVQGVLWLTHHV
ncbi:MAG: hypothetical protein ACYCXA_01660 [Actinomycetes bacterium]